MACALSPIDAQESTWRLPRSHQNSTHHTHSPGNSQPSPMPPPPAASLFPLPLPAEIRWLLGTPGQLGAGVCLIPSALSHASSCPAKKTSLVFLSSAQPPPPRASEQAGLPEASTEEKSRESQQRGQAEQL